jgi:hypothetical protein
MKKKKSIRKANKYTLLHRSNTKFATKNLELLSENANLKDSLIKVENKIEDILQVKESLQLQNQTLEKRLLATEVELLRKIVALYEKQQPQQVVYNYPSSNGVSTGTTNTFATTSSTMLGV